ncbi:MAG: hypothetical protein ACFBSC_18015 [Microcoleaceae cyanobacterium]
MPSYKTVTDNKSVVWDHYPKRKELLKAHGTSDVWLIDLEEGKKAVADTQLVVNRSLA